MTLAEWERANSPIEEYYHAGQYCAWAVRKGVTVDAIVTATGDTKAEAKDNLCSQLGVDPQ